jgi:hypothetical protein
MTAAGRLDDLAGLASADSGVPLHDVHRVFAWLARRGFLELEIDDYGDGWRSLGACLPDVRPRKPP